MVSHKQNLNTESSQSLFVRSAMHPQWYVCLERGEYSENPNVVRGFVGKRGQHGKLFTPDGIAVDLLMMCASTGKAMKAGKVIKHIDGDLTNNKISNLKVEKRATFEDRLVLSFSVCPQCVSTSTSQSKG